MPRYKTNRTEGEFRECRICAFSCVCKKFHTGASRRENSKFLCKLAGSYKRPLDSKYGTGLKARIRSKSRAHVRYSVHRAIFKSRKAFAGRYGDKHYAREKCYQGGKSRVSRFFKSHLSCSKKGRGAKAGYQSEKAEQLSKVPAFQDGGCKSSQRYDSNRGLASKVRSVRRLLLSKHTQSPSSVSEVQVQGKSVRVPLSPFRDSNSPVFIHKDVKSPSFIPKKIGDTNDHLSRRYFDHESIKRSGNPRLQTGNKSSRTFRFSDKLQKVGSDTHSVSGVHRIYNRHMQNDSCASTTKSGKDKEIVSGGPYITIDNTKVVRGDRKPHSIYSSCLSSSSPLQVPSGCKKSSTKVLQQLRSTGSSDMHSETGVTLVDKSFRELEWQIDDKATPYHNNSKRCFRSRLGRSVRKNENRGSLVGIRKRPTHKCERTSCSFSFFTGISKRKIKCHSSCSDRQQNYSGLSKQNGGNCVKMLQPNSIRHLELVHFKKCIDKSRLYSRSRECGRRLGVQTQQGLEQLETGCDGLQATDEQNHAVRGGPVCGPDECAATPVLELATRSKSDQIQRIDPSMEQDKRVCFSTILHDSPSCEKSKGGKDNIGTSDTSMVVSTMVCEPAGDVHSEPLIATKISNNSHISKQNDSPTGVKQQSAVNRMVNLRQSYHSMQLSETTQELLLGSWSKGTSSSYNSAWKKWHSWCMEREIDPVSAPLSHILEYLSKLHTNGLQYRSINVHRSAISSVHAYIDKVPVGQHFMVRQLMKGILRSNPPLPRYKEFWNVDQVLSYIISLPVNESLSMKILSKKLAVLLAIAAPKRVSEIARLDKNFMSIAPNSHSVRFFLPGLSKTQKDASTREVVYDSFPQNPQICVFECLSSYIDRTEHWRSCDKETSKYDPLLRSTVKPHKGVSPNTVSRWIKDMLSAAGIDISIFKAHSTRGASSSKAFQQGVSVNEIIALADWSSSSTFCKYYKRNVSGRSFTESVFHIGKYLL